MNREHCSRIWKIAQNRYFFNPTSNYLGSWPWRQSPTLYFTHTAVCSSDESLEHPSLCRYHPSLCCYHTQTATPHAVSLVSSRILRYPLDARYLAVRKLPRYPLNFSCLHKETAREETANPPPNAGRIALSPFSRLPYSSSYLSL